MNINRIQVTIEPMKYPRSNEPTVIMLRINVERWPGEEIHLERAVPDDAMLSLWDHIWKAAGETLERELKEYL